MEFDLVVDASVMFLVGSRSWGLFVRFSYLGKHA